VTGKDRLRGGELNAALTDELVGIHAEHLGRGPAAASTFYHGNMIVTTMHDALTKAEKVLVKKGRGDDVTEVRSLLRQQMEADLRAAVERLTGQKVLALLSGHHLEPDVSAVIFVLDGEL
jgi:uncharacterized protein YbcI